MNLTPAHTSISSGRGEAGSALITAIVFSTIIMVGLGGLLPMLLTDWKMNARSGGQEVAFNLAEAGVEDAIWAITEHADAADWVAAGWSESANTNYWYREFTLTDISTYLGDIYTLDEGRVGAYRVVVQKTGSTVIHIISQGLVVGGRNVASDFSASRYIEVKFKRPNPFEYGLVARDGANFNGQPEFDSYDSRVFPYDYSYGMNSGQEVVVGSVNLDSSRISLGNAKIFGDLATGANDDSSDPFARNSITGEVIYDFKIDFPSVVIPDTTGWNTSI